MQFKLRSLFSLLLMIVAAYAVISARHWSFRSALFPLATAIPLFVLAGTQLILELFGGQETTSGPAVELEFSSDVDSRSGTQAVARNLSLDRRFHPACFSGGFSHRRPGVHLFLLEPAKPGRLAAIVRSNGGRWGIFYFLFQWLLNVQFEAGAIQTWIGW